MVFSVVMYGGESWTIKKAEHERIDAFQLCCWRRLLRVPWIFKDIQLVHSKGNQSWVFIGRSDAEAETTIKDAKNWLIWKDSDAGEDWRREEKGMTEDEMDDITDLMDMSLRKLQELVMDKKASQSVGHDWVTELNWEDLTNHLIKENTDMEIKHNKKCRCLI